MDVFSPSQRSEVMRRVRSTGTAPEIIVRRIVRRMGVKYRSCVESLPGKPDIVVNDQRKAIFVHGCFWHGHQCKAGKLPRSNRSYWKSKQARNLTRDSRNAKALRSGGWKLMTLWECQMGSRQRLQSRLLRFLRPQK